MTCENHCRCDRIVSLRSVARIQTGLNSCNISQRQNKRKQPCRSSSADEVTCRRNVSQRLSHRASRPLRWRNCRATLFGCKFWVDVSRFSPNCVRVINLSRKKKTFLAAQNLQRNNVARRVEGFCISYFAALRGAKTAFLNGPTEGTYDEHPRPFYMEVPRGFE